MATMLRSGFHHDWLKKCLDWAMEADDKERYIRVLENALKELKKDD